MEQKISRPIAITILLNSALAFYIFYLLANHRNIDGDEGLYLEAARLVSHGKKLYLDFFFQQMPLTPYLYSIWMKVFGFNLFSPRYLSVLLTSLSGASVLIYAAYKTRNVLVVNLLALAFFANGLVLAWAPVIKTHPLTMFALTGASLFLLYWRNTKKIWSLILASFVLGLGINGRLTLGPFAIVFLIFIYLNSKEDPWKNLALFIAVMAFTSLPTFYYVFSDPAEFFRFNLKYHTEVYPGVVGMDRRAQTLGNLIGRAQFILLLAASQLAFISEMKTGILKFFKTDSGFLFIILGVFFLIHISSAEPYTQYFVAMVPLFLMFLAPYLEKIVTFKLRFAVPALGAFFLIYLSDARASMNFEIASMMSNRPEWSIKNVLAVAQKAKKIMLPGDTCVAWWPGYAFLAGCDTVPGMENHMRTYAIDRMPEETVRKYKMLPDSELLNDIKFKKYRIVIDGVYHNFSPYYYEIRDQLDENYTARGEGVKTRNSDRFPASFDKN